MLQIKPRMLKALKHKIIRSSSIRLPFLRVILLQYDL